MEARPNLIISETGDQPFTRDFVSVHSKYYYPLIGFVIGSFISMVILLIEEFTIDYDVVPRGTQLHHVAIPFFFGIIGAIVGIFQVKRVHKKNSAINDLLLSQQTLNLILDSMPQMISYLDTDLIFRYNNKSYEHWMGLSTDKIYGKKLQEIVSRETFDLISSSLAKITNSEIIHLELSRKSKGKERYSMAMLIPHFGTDQKLKGYFTVVTDVTQLRKRENKIKKQKDQLEEMNAGKDKFFSIISHDLKNPFNSLLGFSELLHNDFDTLDEATKKEFAGHIYESAQNTYKLLENLLAWSTAQSGKIEFNPSPVSINVLVAENLKLLVQSARAKDIQLQSDLKNDYLISTDHDLINTVIRNLLTNAIKFTPKDGRVTISANLVSGIQSDEYLEISVKDTGLGIAPENLEKLFKIGKSISTSGTEGESGTGLGLMLCKEFIEKCGGKIWVESEVGKGSIFYFTVPYNHE